MKHVFVETNWVFDLCAPAHRATPEARASQTALLEASSCFTYPPPRSGRAAT